MATVDVLELLIDVATKLDGIDNAQGKLAGLMGQLETYDEQEYEADLDVNTSSAFAELATAESVFNAFESDIDKGFSLDDKDLELMQAEAKIDVEAEVGDAIDNINKKLESGVDGGILADKDLEVMKADAKMELEDEAGDLIEDMQRRMGIDEVFDIEGISRDLDITSDEGRVTDLSQFRRKGLITGINDNFREMNLRMSQFYDLLADLLPLLFVFIAALPAAIAGIVALGAAALAAAGAMGAIGALGVFGMGVQESGGTEGAFGEITNRLSELGNEILDTFAPLATRFAPLIRDAFDGLLRTFEQIAVEMQGLLELRSAASQFGQWLSDAIVGLVDLAIRLTDAFIPLFEVIAEAIGDANIIQFLVNVLTKSLPEIKTLFEQVAGAIVEIIQISEGFLEVAVFIGFLVGAIYDLILSITSILTPLSDTRESLGVMIGLILTAITVSIVYGKALALLTVLNNKYLVSLFKLIFAYAYKISVTVGLTAAKWAEIAVNYVLSGSYGTLAGSIALATVTLLAFLTVLTLGIATLTIAGAGVKGLTDKFTSLDSNVKEATKSLENFGKTRDRIGGMGDGGFGAGGGRGGTTYYDNTVNIEGGDDNTMRREARKIFHRENFKGQSTSR